MLSGRVMELEHALSAQLRRSLVRNLNTDNRWCRIVEGLETYRIPLFLSINSMHDMESRGISPADWVLEELIDRLCLFDEFCNMLKEFDLLEEYFLLNPAVPEVMVIKEQPGDGEETMLVEDGDAMSLTCTAYGIPRPTYQWYHDNCPLAGQTNSLLTINPFSEENVGTYHCVVKQEIRGHISKRLSSEVMVDLIGVKPVLLQDLPQFYPVNPGEDVFLEVLAEGYPAPKYEWYRSDSQTTYDYTDQNIMPNIPLSETSNKLEVDNIGPEDEGLYICNISNAAGSTFSRKCSLFIRGEPPNSAEDHTIYDASAKVALLIGNGNYWDNDLGTLEAPSKDVVTLTEILEELGFHVIALHNLTRTEMLNAFKWFCRILPKDAYAFFYFAGHGVSKVKSMCMMPIDCPSINSIRFEDLLCEEHLSKILSNANKLQLLVMIFDHCLEECGEMGIGKTEFNHRLNHKNIVIGTATRNHQYAYESDEDANGLYIKHLKNHLKKKKPITEVLHENMKDFKQEENEQCPTLNVSGPDKCSLTDPVRDDPVLKEELQNEVNFPSYEEEIYFEKIDQHFTLNISKHKGTFLNSIDLQFSPNFKYDFRVEINQQVVELEVYQVSDQQKGFTIYNLQRAKGPLGVTVYIIGFRQVDNCFFPGPYDSCFFRIDCPIVSKTLWFED